MADRAPTMQEAVAAALADGASDDTEDDEGTADDAEATTDTDETGAKDEQDSSESTEDEDSEDEASADADVTEDDVPTVYFGEDLSAFDAKTRAAIIEIVKPRDQHIQSLLREKATEAKAEDAPDGEAKGDAVPEDTTDDELLADLGLKDIADPDDPVTKALLLVTRFSLGLKDEVSELRTKGELSDTKAYWETSLASLEKQYGALPASHEEVMKEAAKAGVAEPMAAYWLIMGPGRQQLMAEVTKRRDEAAKTLKGKQKPIKPRTSQNTEDIPIEADNVGAALKIALSQMGKERGWDLTQD